MGEFWNILGLEPTRDIAVIKRAYARKTRTCHPEENPQGFLELRKAYQEDEQVRHLIDMPDQGQENQTRKNQVLKKQTLTGWRQEKRIQKKRTLTG